MTEDLHAKAKRLIEAARVEGISQADRGWMDGHLEGCARCAELAQSTEAALRSLRSVSVRVDPALVSRTQRRVHLRARELSAQRATLLPLWIFCALSWVLGVVSAPLVWRACEWLGHWTGVPDLMWQMGFVLWWTLPALGVAAMLTVRARQAAE
jgi:hypothetical protein